MTAAATLQRLALRRAQEWVRKASAVWTGEDEDDSTSGRS
jgi:hypothetical protein